MPKRREERERQGDATELGEDPAQRGDEPLEHAVRAWRCDTAYASTRAEHRADHRRHGREHDRVPQGAE